MLLNMYDGHVLSVKAIMKGVDNVVNNTNYKLDEIYKMTYFDYILYKYIRKEVLEEEKNKQEGDTGFSKGMKPPSSSFPNFNNIKVPKVPTPNIPKF